MYIVDCLVEKVADALDRPFTYYSKQPINEGVRVRVRFRSQVLTAYVLKVTLTSLSLKEAEEQYGFKIMPILDVIDEAPILNEELLALAKHMAKLTLSPLIACLQTMLPGSLKPSSGKTSGPIYLQAVRIIREGTPKTPKQQEVYHDLHAAGDHFVKDYSRAVISSLEKQGFVEVYKKEIYRDPFHMRLEEKHQEITLTSAQAQVVAGIMQRPERISLIHGVTGSGKTEVYIALSREILKQGQNVIMLVPEISLTPMMVAIFKQRFGDAVAILHSRLSQGERYDEYRRIRDGQVRIVVGARSAIFAPLAQIGLIIMDEEHDSSYKQENTPRYHTLSIARYRAHAHHARIVLGSATPSVESYARAQKGVYDLYEMPIRINKKPLPQVDIVNMVEETKAGHYELMSRKLKGRLQETLDRGEQAIVLLNKRGYASFVLCEECQETIKCPHCDVTLTYHKNDGTLKCHYCGYSITMPHICPHCGAPALKKIGYGTQKIEEELNHTIQGAKVIRFDYDTTRNKNDHLRLLEAFAKNEGNILLGTQMIAKGLDFENVTFVGVLSADLTLMIPDYRASERTFDLLTQVAGRSGRGQKAGSVLIQTFNPTHYAITMAAKQDYQGFFNEEMKFRRQALYPPYCHLVSIIIQSRSSEAVKAASLDIKNYLVAHLHSVKALGPSEAAVFKMQDFYRERILVKYIKSEALLPVLKSLMRYYNVSQNGKVTMVCDFNPYTQI